MEVGRRVGDTQTSISPCDATYSVTLRPKRSQRVATRRLRRSRPPARGVPAELRKKVAVVSVMGAFRTGKSFLLDLMLRHPPPPSPGS